MSTPIIDVHCHNFNGDDLPIRGFIQRVHFDDNELVFDLVALADSLVQGRAPGYWEEVQILDRLLAGGSYESAFERSEVGVTAGLEADIEASLDAEVDQTMAQLEASNPALLRRLGTGLLEDEDIGAAEGYEGIGDWISAARRGVRWVKLFAKRRIDITRHLVKAFPGVNLFVPYIVDLGLGLNDRPETTARQQMELQEKICRLSMMGVLPGGGDSRIHPFFGFDPRQQVRAEIAGDIETPLYLLEKAVKDYGFIGVKLYPPMGWRPLANKQTVDMSQQEAELVDEALLAFYDLCLREQIPITAHCNASNEAHRSFKEFSDPDLWKLVLEDFKDLHLNLGHFGGARENDVDKADAWPWKIARLASSGEYPHLYADVGNHRIDKRAVRDGYVETLKKMFADPDTEGMQEQLMYGSDWYMLALLPEHEEFLEEYRKLYDNAFGDTAKTTRFMGGAALSFLGFDDADNENAKRLIARYEAHAPARCPRWLAGAAVNDRGAFDIPG